MSEHLSEEYFPQDGEPKIVSTPLENECDEYIPAMKESAPNPEGLELLRKGRLNKETGEVAPRTSKAVVAKDKAFSPSQEYLDGYSKIQWRPQLTL